MSFNIKANILNVIRRVVLRERSDSSVYIQFLKESGVEIGDSVEIFTPRLTTIDVTSPHLLSIGSNVSMTGPVCILVHDYSVCVTKYAYEGYILGKQCKTIVGNNVFLGWGCCVLPGTTIHDNTIIGAYAVVSGNLEANSVYAGNPARRICSLDEYWGKRKDKQLSEAVEIYVEYYKRYSRPPKQEVFHEYFFLFSSGKKSILNPCFEKKMYDHGNYERTLEAWNNNEPIFDSYDEFCNYARQYLK